jgi:predicted CopG family antitoxin
MSTTIRVQDDVYAALERLKRELNAESYDQVIKHLIRKSKRRAKKRQKLLAEADEVRERTRDLGISVSKLIREDRDAR